MKQLLGTTANGKEIYKIVDDTHMAAHQAITDELLAEGISLIHYDGPFYIESVDFGRVIGKDGCVEVDDSDNIYMLFRKNREFKTPIVFNKEPEDTSLLTIGICTDGDGLDTVFTAFMGQKVPKEPMDPRVSDKELPEAKAFWDTHALVYQPGMLDEKRNPRVKIYPAEELVIINPNKFTETRYTIRRRETES